MPCVPRKYSSIRKITAKISAQKKKPTKPRSSPLKSRPSSVFARFTFVRSFGRRSHSSPARVTDAAVHFSIASRRLSITSTHGLPARHLQEDLLQVCTAGSRPGSQLVHRPERDDLAVVDDRDAVTQRLRDLERVRGQEDRAAVPDERRGTDPSAAAPSADRARPSARRPQSARADE